MLGSLGETSYEESSIDVSTAEALPDGWNFLLDGSKISVNGSFQTQTAAADLQAGKMILISGESQRAYQLTQTPSEGDDGTNVTVKAGRQLTAGRSGMGYLPGTGRCSL